MKKALWGIKKKTMTFYVIVLLVAFLFIYITTDIVVKSAIEANLREKYEYINEKAMIRLEDYYQESDALLEKFIASSVFQDSLRREGLSKKQVIELRKELSYMTMSCLERSIYVDNKGNVYGEVPAGVHGQTLDNWIADFGLDHTYSSTKWQWKADIAGAESGEALYAARLLRHIEYPVDPGVIVLCLDEQLFKDVLSDSVEVGVKRAIFTADGRVSYQGSSEELTDTELANCKKAVQAKEADLHVSGELYLIREEHDSGFFIVTVIPNSVMSGGMSVIRIYLAIFFAIACVGAYLFSVYFSGKLTKPVEQINRAMNQYRTTNSQEHIQLNSETELDTIAENYNEMVDQIADMVVQIRDDERKMYKLQLDSLMYQINPHFLYNILDNIYMLARIDKNERTMKMIQALSDFLRIGLSNERDIITVEKELEHVRCYVEMQQIRNNALFDYEADCDEETAKCHMLKIILQPIVENAIKHGFALMQTGGLIRVSAKKEGTNIRFRVWNNGVPIDENTLTLLNRIQNESIENMRSIFQNRSGGYGIHSVAKRLKLKYGDRFALYYQDEADGVSCNIVVPIEQDEETIISEEQQDEKNP